MEEENGIIEETEQPNGAEAHESTEIEGAEPSQQEETPANPAAEPEKKENKVQKRIDEITRARREAEQQADYWRRVAMGEIQPPKQETQQPQGEELPPGLPPKPQLEQFEDYDAYVEALGAWGAEKTFLAREHKEAQRKVKAAQEEVIKTHAARVEVAKAKYTDWDDVVALAEPMNFADDTFTAIMESDNSADLAYHLFNHPEDVKRIEGLSKVQQVKEIARLEAKFQTPATPPVKRISQAPTPINPLGGENVAAGIPKEPDPTTDPDAWLSWERQRVAKLGRRY